PQASLSRRRALRHIGLAGVLPWASLALAAGAAPTQNRLIVVLLRGGLDGLGAVPAVGDPAFAAARGVLADYASPALPLGGPSAAGSAGFFALHPNLGELHRLYGRGEALVVHATGLPYRERSHFDAQQVLESGGTRPYEISTGWLARALAADKRRGMALNTAVPLVLRGPGEIDTWAPSALPEPSNDLVARLARLYATDPALSQALSRARGLREDPEMAAGMASPSPGMSGIAGSVGRQAVVALARKAAEFAAQAHGPQALVLEMGGWDTHANQAAPQGALANNLGTLDAALAALREGLSSPAASGAWARTAIAVVTEFGREVAVNGTQGTDHGTGGTAFLLGGAVRGGRVIADWPGLAKAQRHEGRDLRITTDLRALFKPLLVQHLGLPAQQVEQVVFPESGGVKGLDLLRA
ncbi:MAG: hypothetical protein RLZZ182_2314, partial [Pseudomonadota bacterium]